MQTSNTAIERQRAPSEFAAASRRLEGLFQMLRRARKCLHLSVDEAAVFLALGQLSLSQGRSGLIIQFVACAEVSEYLGIPKETVRRKIARLADVGLAHISPRGVVIKNESAWLRCVEEIFI